MPRPQMVASEAMVPTSMGPRFASCLAPKVGVMVIDPRGRLREASVVAVEPASRRPMVRLLTNSGEITLDSQAVLTTRRGRMYAIDVARQVRRGTQARIELARTADLPTGPPTDERAALRAGLACLDPPVIRIPRAADRHPAAKQLLEVADVPFLDVSDERWSAFTFDADGLDAQEVPPSTRDVSLFIITAWEERGMADVSRTTLEQKDLRRRLVAALTCAGASAETRWLPGYRPVEARVTWGTWRPYATVKAARVEHGPVLQVQLDSDCSLICDLAILAPAQPRRGLDADQVCSV